MHSPLTSLCQMIPGERRCFLATAPSGTVVMVMEVVVVVDVCTHLPHAVLGRRLVRECRRLVRECRRRECRRLVRECRRLVRECRRLVRECRRLAERADCTCSVSALTAAAFLFKTLPWLYAQYKRSAFSEST